MLFFNQTKTNCANFFGLSDFENGFVGQNDKLFKIYLAVWTIFRKISYMLKKSLVFYLIFKIKNKLATISKNIVIGMIRKIPTNLLQIGHSVTPYNDTIWKISKNEISQKLLFFFISELFISTNHLYGYFWRSRPGQCTKGVDPSSIFFDA